MADVSVPHADLSEALQVFIEKSYGRPFRWGEHDCALWVADWIQARRGIDVLAAYRGTYATAVGCARTLKREGGLQALFDRACVVAGIATIPADAAGIGDAVLIAAARGPTLAIAAGASRLALLGFHAPIFSSVAGPRLAAWKV